MINPSASATSPLPVRPCHTMHHTNLTRSLSLSMPLHTNVTLFEEPHPHNPSRTHVIQAPDIEHACMATRMLHVLQASTPASPSTPRRASINPAGTASPRMRRSSQVLTLGRKKRDSEYMAVTDFCTVKSGHAKTRSEVNHLMTRELRLRDGCKNLFRWVLGV